VKDNIAKIRAALELARDYITSDLASERGAFEGYEGVSRIDEIKADLASNAAALAALAELERAAKEPYLYMAQPIAGDYARYSHPMVSYEPAKCVANAADCYYAEFRAVPLYTAPPVVGAKLYTTPPPAKPAPDIYDAYKSWPEDIRKKLSLHDLRRMSGWRMQAEFNPLNHEQSR